MSELMTWMVRGRGIEHITPRSPCYELPGLPPPDDFVVFVDVGGKVYRWRDSRWVIGTVALNFGYEPESRQTLDLTPANGELLKLCIAWFMWGDRRSISCNSLRAYHLILKRLFAACSGLEVPIIASEMGRYFESFHAELASAIRPSVRNTTIGLLNELQEARRWLGFELLSPSQIARLHELVPDHEVEQKHFIPPRIWAYQAGRMQAFLEDFLAHKAQFEALLREIVAAYRTNFGSLANAATSTTTLRNPCDQTGQVEGCVYPGSFADLARRHGVANVIVPWMTGSGVKSESPDAGLSSITALGKYFNAIGLVGTSYLQCFSGMRIGEAMTLRSNCLSIERDAVLGDIHVLSGETTKTTKDSDARWMTAPTAISAVDAMSAIARWRTDIAIEMGTIPMTAEDRANPYLVLRAHEPWSMGTRKNATPSSRPGGYDISDWRIKVPGLFDDETLRITAEDETYVRRFSANTDMTKYGVGCVWHFTSHQYRRSIHVYMAASGVSLPTRQYQLKHITDAQSAYYAHGHENLRLNRSFGHELVSVRYELVAVDAGLLKGPNYVSPHGEARKSELLRFFDVSSREQISKAQRNGKLTIRQTVVGICTARYCQYGGFDNYVHCPGCLDGLMDKRKRPVMKKEGRTIAVRLVDAPAGTPLRAALEAKQKAISEFLNVTA